MPNSFIAIVRDANYDDKQKIALLTEGLESNRSTLDEQGEHGESVLHEACFNGGAELLEWLLSKKSELIAAKSRQGTNPLFYAAKYNNKNAVEYLLKQKCSFDLVIAINDYGRSMLFFAALGGNVELFKQLQAIRGDWLLTINKDNSCSFDSLGLMELLELIICDNHLAMFKFLVETFNSEVIKNLGKSIVQIPNKYGQYLFYLAAANGNLTIVRYLLDRVTDYDHLEIAQECMSQPQANESGNTAIHIAAMKGHLDVVKFLAELQIEFNQPNKKGSYLLHIATEYEQLAVIEYLVNVLKVDINQHEKNEFEESALSKAVTKGYLPVVQCLIRLGAKFNEPNNEGYYLLHEACLYRHIAIVRYLVEELKVDINQPTVNKFRPLKAVALSIAAFNGYLEIVQYLITKGAIDLSAREAVSALHATAYEGQQQVADWLISRGDNVNKSNGETVVHIAAYYGHLAYLKFVIEKHQAKYDQADDQGYLPFHLAISQGHLPIVKYFITEKGLPRELITKHKTPKSPWQLAFESDDISVVVFFYQSILLYTEEIKHFFRNTSHNNKFILIYCILANAIDLNDTYDKLKSWQIVTDLELDIILQKFKEELFQHAKAQSEFMRLNKFDYTAVLYVEEAAKKLHDVALICKDFALPKLSKDLCNEILSHLIPNSKEYKKISPAMIINAQHPNQQLDSSHNMANKFHAKLSARIRFFDRLNRQLRPCGEKKSRILDEDERITKRQRT